MKMLTKANEKALPALGSQDDKPASEIRIRVKFFNPQGAGTWYATEYDPVDRIFFGYAVILQGCGELGSFSLDEMSAYRGRFGLGIERDLHWDDTTTLDTIIDRGW